jgi:hypothetical protein
MMGMTGGFEGAGFEKPEYFRLFFLLIPAVFISALHFRKFFHLTGFVPRYASSAFFFLLFYSCIVFAAASPHWGYTLSVEARQ